MAERESSESVSVWHCARIVPRWERGGARIGFRPDGSSALAIDRQQTPGLPRKESEMHSTAQGNFVVHIAERLETETTYSVGYKQTVAKISWSQYIAHARSNTIIH